jgi:hypothetical protein
MWVVNTNRTRPYMSVNFPERLRIHAIACLTTWCSMLGAYQCFGEYTRRWRYHAVYFSETLLCTYCTKGCHNSEGHNARIGFSTTTSTSHYHDAITTRRYFSRSVTSKVAFGWVQYTKQQKFNAKVSNCAINT